MKWTCTVATKTLKQMRKDLFHADNDLRCACWQGEARVLVQNDDGSTIHYGKEPKP